LVMLVACFGCRSPDMPVLSRVPCEDVRVWWRGISETYLSMFLGACEAMHRRKKGALLLHVHFK
jgi:hypothetical protein